MIAVGPVRWSRASWAVGASCVIHAMVLAGALRLRRSSAEDLPAPIEVTLMEPPPAVPATPVEASKPPLPVTAVHNANPVPPSAVGPTLRAVARNRASVAAPEPIAAPPEVLTAASDKAVDSLPDPVAQTLEKSPIDGAGVDSRALERTASGVARGVVGVRTHAPPPPPPPPKAPTLLDVETVRKRRIAGSDPPYPPRAESKGTEGVVVVRVVIDSTGRVIQSVILQTHPAFEQAVRDSIAQWRFTPHRVGGTAVSVYTVFRFTFKLT